MIEIKPKKIFRVIKGPQRKPPEDPDEFKEEAGVTYEPPEKKQ